MQIIKFFIFKFYFENFSKEKILNLTIYKYNIKIVK